MKYAVLVCFILFQVAVCEEDLSRVRRATGLIVNGENAGRGNFPGFVWIFSRGSFYCGGSILDSRTILTAAHCADNRASTYQVAVGKYRYNGNDESQLIDVASITPHEDYAFPNDDIALFHLDEDIIFNDLVQPANLALTARAESNKTLCYAVGAGGDDQSGDTDGEPRVLQKLETFFVNRKRCRRLVQRELDFPARYITKTVLCTLDDNAGVCFGDSGGPVGCYNSAGEYVQYGLLSYGSTVCTDGFNVFTRISKYRNWINANK